MNEWEIAAAVLGAASVPCLGVCVLSGAMGALVAMELAGTVIASALMLLAEGFHRQPFIDLALLLALLSLVGGMAFARLMEHDL
jgi:multisubunit Na+/H+ antiporter MnhF subunit